MKKFCLIAVLLMMVSMAFAQNNSYDIEEIYLAQNLKSGTLGLTKRGNSVELEKILVPVKVDTGRYSIYIQRVDTNLYEIIGKDIFIKTKYCYEYTYRENVIMEITSIYGFSIGKIYFDK
jgi:hypothetical protein